MLSSLFALVSFFVVFCHGQTFVTTSIVAPTTSIVTYKTLRCSTYYGPTKVSKVPRTTVDFTTKYTYTYYPSVFSNYTTAYPTCYSQYTDAAANVLVAATPTRFPLEVYCTKAVEIIRATYVTSPTTTLTRYVYSYPTTNPTGVQYGVYPNPEGPDTDATYSAFNPVPFRNTTPYYHGLTNAVGLSGAGGAGYVQFYNSPVAFNQSYFAINHRFYLAAPQTGVYTVSMPKADDIALLWVNTTAYYGWNRTNAALTVTSGSAATTTYSFTAAAGSYVPIRVLYANAANAYALSFTLTAPNGTVLLGPNTKGSSSIIQYSCAGYAGPAPPFAPFGEENLLIE